MSDENKFGELRLSVKGTNNGRGFDIFYDFGKSLNFVEFTSKNEFYFVQPWMQFPSNEYTDACMRVSIELVRRFNEFERMEQRAKQAEAHVEKLIKEKKVDCCRCDSLRGDNGECKMHAQENENSKP